MKKTVFGIFLVILFSVRVSAQENPLKTVSIEEAVSISAHNLEKKFGIVFPENWQPKIGFDFLGELDEESELFEASYCPAEKRLFFHSRYRRNYVVSEMERDTLFLDSDTSLLALARQAIYHELGHIYADCLGREIGLGEWPEEGFFSGTDTVGEFMMPVLAEGIAEYFCRSLLVNLKPQNVVLESNNEDIYEMSYQLVKPILDAYGVRDGVAYIITHPPSGNGHDRSHAILWYQKRALDKK